jgi:hypothetical protein
MPEECQSIPMTAPKDWNQKGLASPQKFVASVMLDNGLGDHRTETCHPVAKPFRHASAVQWKIGAACSLCQRVVSTGLCNRLAE